MYCYCIQPVTVLLLLVVSLCSTVGTLRGEETALKPKLGSLGKQRLNETFTGPKLSKTWRATFGELKATGEKLSIRQMKKDNHAAAIRVSMPIQDCVVSFECLLNGCQFLHFGFDPAKGELKKKGHLYSIVIKASSVSILHHHDKLDPKAKSKVLATQKLDIGTNESVKVVIENRGERVRVQVGENPPIEANHPEFSVKKPGLVFRVAGTEENRVEVDNLKVWEYAPRP